MPDSVAGRTNFSRRRVLQITAVAGVGGILGGNLLSEFVRQGKLHRVTSTRSGMGTLITITAVDVDPARGRSYIEDAFATIEALERVLSRHREDTPVARLNREGVLPNAPRELVHVLTEAQALAASTAGAFDITMAPLLELYTLRYGQGRRPSADEVTAARSRVGYASLSLEGSRVEFTRPGMSVTLDGIAKGYVVDRIVDGLYTSGYDSVLVDAGGDMGSRGTLEVHWNVAVQDPHNASAVTDIVSLEACTCIATSGDYMQAFSADRSSHPVIDPRTGFSPRQASSATVTSPSAMTSDALSTAALVMGPHDGLELLESLERVEGLIVGKDGARYVTQGWAGLDRAT